jgi:hypothetical protein
VNTCLFHPSPHLLMRPLFFFDRIHVLVVLCQFANCFVQLFLNLLSILAISMMLATDTYYLHTCPSPPPTSLHAA